MAEAAADRLAQEAEVGIGSDDGHDHAPAKKLLKSSKNPFDTKDAKDNPPRYDGKAKKEY